LQFNAEDGRAPHRCRLQWQPEVELHLLEVLLPAFPEIGGYRRELFQGGLEVLGYLLGDEIGVFEVG
jgi:hypothetical protein